MSILNKYGISLGFSAKKVSIREEELPNGDIKLSFALKTPTIERKKNKPAISFKPSRKYRFSTTGLRCRQDYIYGGGFIVLIQQKREN